ncbi:hypothetical protein [Bacillus sp. OAE603]|uniref:hypothetical protein n=1 Tax=Gottfriedia sp. OAE603 TaxID=2663872 RepID=UPI001789B4A6
MNENNSQKEFHALLKELEPYIYRNVKKLPIVYQDDLEQEIKILIYEKYLDIDNIIAEPPGFFDFFNEEE